MINQMKSCLFIIIEERERDIRLLLVAAVVVVNNFY